VVAGEAAGAVPARPVAPGPVAAGVVAPGTVAAGPVVASVVTDPLTAPVALVTAPAAAPAAPAGGTPLQAQWPRVRSAGEAVYGLSDPLRTEPPVATWPCHGCSELNPIDADTCQHCFLPFLGGAHEQPTTKLPIVGDVRSLSKGGRAAVTAGGILVCCGLFLLAAYIVGSVF
jgi:hypothetical protein